MKFIKFTIHKIQIEFQKLKSLQRKEELRFFYSRYWSLGFHTELRPQLFSFFVRQGLTKTLNYPVGSQIWIFLPQPHRVLRLHTWVTVHGGLKTYHSADPIEMMVEDTLFCSKLNGRKLVKFIKTWPLAFTYSVASFVSQWVKTPYVNDCAVVIITSKSRAHF